MASESENTQILTEQKQELITKASDVLFDRIKTKLDQDIKMIISKSTSAGYTSSSFFTVFHNKREKMPNPYDTLYVKEVMTHSDLVSRLQKYVDEKYPKEDGTSSMKIYYRTKRSYGMNKFPNIRYEYVANWGEDRNVEKSVNESSYDKKTYNRGNVRGYGNGRGRGRGNLMLQRTMDE